MCEETVQKEPKVRWKFKGNSTLHVLDVPQMRLFQPLRIRMEASSRAALKMLEFL
jgi:hypothetical protein